MAEFSEALKVIWKLWPWQIGGAFTLPVPGRKDRVIIWVKRTEMLPGHSGGYEYLRVHERVHAAQIEKHGVVWYWLRVVLWARFWSLITSGSILARKDPVEREAYEEADRFLAGGRSPYADNGAWTAAHEVMEEVSDGDSSLPSSQE